MELEKLISEKIRLEEFKPIRWEKERVWNNIQRDKKSQEFITYLIAASIALVCSLTFYFIQTNLDQNMSLRIAILESKVDQYNHEVSETAIEEPAITQENCTDAIIQPGRVKGDKVLGSIPLVTMMIPVHDSINMAALEVPRIDSIHISSLAVEERLVENIPKIEAIIGVIPAEHKPIRIAREKKLRVKFSREHYEFLSDDDPKEHVLTARIN